MKIPLLARALGSKSCNIHNDSMQHKTLEYPFIYSFKLLNQ